jgi:Bacterial Ig-like domain (group 1)
MPRFITLLVVVAGIAAAAAAPVSAGSLEFEYLQGTEVTLQDIQCNPEGTSTATFLVTGTAGGPHPGTFEARVTLTAGSQRFGAGPLLTLDETFEIVSADTLISGTKRLVPRQERFYPFSCGVTPSGECEEVSVRASAPGEALRYEATINGPEGTQQERGYTEFSISFDGVRCGGEMQFSSGAMDQFFTLVISPNDPTTVVLTPATAENTVNTFHELTATVTDENGQLVSGAIVRFNVAGLSSASGDCMTDASGECRFSYQVGLFPGEDTISAYADVDADDVQDAGEPTGTATKTIILPPSTPTPGRTTGEGKFVDNRSGEVTFTLNARSDGSTLRGSCKFIEKASGTTIKCLDVLSYIQHENAARFYGHAEQDGVATLYTIEVVDHGQPGSDPADFVLIATAAGYSASGAVTNGDIQVR